MLEMQDMMGVQALTNECSMDDRATNGRGGSRCE